MDDSSSRASRSMTSGQTINPMAGKSSSLRKVEQPLLVSESLAKELVQCDELEFVRSSRTAARSSGTAMS